MRSRTTWQGFLNFPAIFFFGFRNYSYLCPRNHICLTLKLFNYEKENTIFSAKGFLAERLKNCFATNSEELADNILDYTNNHPYYSQQLASSIWNIGTLQPETEDVLHTAIDHIVTTHGLDYERLWMGISRTSKWILQRLASNSVLQTGEYPTSTIYSALKRLQKDGYVIYSDRYEIEDPFFKEWILRGL